MHVLRPDGVAELSVSGPIDLAWTRSFSDSLAELHGTSPRAVLLVSEGRFFSLGGDLAWMNRQEDRQAALLALASSMHEGVELLVQLDVPVVAKVQGPAAGAGMSLVLLADIVLAAESSYLTMAYTGVGLSPDGGASWLLPRLVGAKRAAEIILSNRKVSAREAEELGLVSRVVEDADLDAAIEELLGALAIGPTASYQATKRLLAASGSATLAEQLAAEAVSISRLAGSPTGREGIAAFLERRPAAFPHLEPATTARDSGPCRTNGKGRQCVDH